MRGRRHGRRNAVAIVLIVLFGVPIVLGAAGLGATAAFKNELLARLAAAGDDRPELVRLRRRRLAARLDPRRAQPPAGPALPDQPVDGEGGDRDRGPALLPARRRRLGGHHPRRLARRCRRGKVVEGGSTITQQLVRNLYISRERTFQRKVKEVCLAFKLSRQWSKDRILAAWMNQVYFGNHAYGVEAAAQTYFSKHAKDLTLMQAALLAGLPQAPSLYDPIVYPRGRPRPPGEVLQALYDNRRDLVRPLPGCAPRHEPPPEAGAPVLADPRAVLLQLRPRPADRDLRRPDRPVRRPARLHDDQPCVPARGPEGDQGHALPEGRPGRGGRLDQPGERRDPGDDVGLPGPNEEPVQPRRPGAAPGRARRSRRSC